MVNTKSKFWLYVGWVMLIGSIVLAISYLIVFADSDSPQFSRIIITPFTFLWGLREIRKNM